MGILNMSDGDHAIQAFPLQKGLVNLTTGVKTDIRLIRCAADGTITITWHDGTTSDIACYEGNDFSVDAKSITVVSGTFHLAK